MNLVGEKLKVLTSPDPTKSGLTGTVLLETANMLLLDMGRKTVKVEKERSAFMISRSGEVLTGLDISGRLQDRLGRRRL